MKRHGTDALGRCVALAVCAASMFSAVNADETPRDDIKQPNPFEAHIYKGEGSGELPYRLLVPEQAEDPMPLILFLHGAGERGDDNEKQLFWGKDLLNKAAREYHAVIVVPQCPAGEWWAGVDRSQGTVTITDEPTEPMRLTQALIDELTTEHNIDTDRMYVMGLSMGGFGSWDAVTRWPGRFAAAVPICGGGDPTQAEVIMDTPIWAFHGDADTVVPVGLTRAVIQAIRDAGGVPKYTEYPGVGHNSWSPAFAEPDLLPWMMMQKLDHPDNE